MGKLSRNTFLKGMNKDASLEIMPSDMYRDARNVMLDSNGNDGSLQNMVGVTALRSAGINWRNSGSNLATDWICTGLVTSDSEDKIYMFLHSTGAPPIPLPPNYYDPNLLVEYDIVSDTYRTILAGFEPLNLEFSSNVIEADFISFRAESYIFWLNYDGTPYKINIEEAAAFTANLATGALTADPVEFAYLISVIQTPPLFPPVIEYTNISDSINVISGIYSFKYRYIYENGGVSAFSPESEIFYDYIVSQTDDNSSGIFYNAIKVDYNEPSETVAYVEIAFKRDTTWFFIPALESQGVGDHTYVFKNDTVYLAVSDSPLDTKYFDNVPITAWAQEFLKGRLFYANYIDGYDAVNDLSLNVAPFYNSISGGLSNVPSSYLTGTWGATHGADVDGPHDEALVITRADIEANVALNSTLSFNWVEYSEYQVVGVKFYRKWFEVICNVQITDYDTALDDLETAVLANVVTLSAEGLINLHTQNNGTQLEIRAFSDLTQYYNSIGSSTSEYIPLRHQLASSLSITGSNNSADTSFKMGAKHKFGVVYYDQYNRQNSVATSPNGEPYVKWFGERLGDPYEGKGSAHMNWHIDSIPPEWATHYQIVYSKNTSTNDFDTYIGGALEQDPGNDDDLWRLFMRPYTRFVNNNPNTSYIYSYQEGDTAHIIGEFNGTDFSYNFPPFSFRVLGTGLDSNGDDFILISNASKLALDAWLLDTYGASDRLAFEIRSSAPNSTEGLFYEIGEVHTIDQPGTGNRTHNGETRNQSDNLAGITQDTELTVVAEGVYETESVANAYQNFKVGDRVTLTAFEVGDTQNPIYGFITGKISEDQAIIKVDETGDIPNIFYEKRVTPTPGASGVMKYGDSFVRIREYDTFWDAGDTALVVPAVVDSEFPTDVITINNDGLGRSQIEQVSKKAVIRDASIIASDNINEDTNFFGTTSFPNNALNFTDLDPSFVQIDKLVSLNDNLYVLQGNRVGIQLVQKSMLTDNAGDGILTSSDVIFGQYNPILDNIGTRGIAQDYVQVFESSMYFVDPDTKVVYVVGGREARDISSGKIRNLLRNHDFTSDPTKRVSGFNPIRKEYLMRLDNVVWVYNSKLDAWVSGLQFFPRHMVTANGGYYSAVDLKLFEHEKEGAPYSRFYDDLGNTIIVNPTITLIPNDQKLVNKSYRSVQVTGLNINQIKAADIATRNSIAPSIDLFYNEEGIMAASLGGGYNKASSIPDRVLGVGTPTSTVADTATFSELTSNVAVNDGIYQDQSGLTYLGEVTSIDRDNNTITINNAEGVFSGTGIICFSKPSLLDGEDIKGEYVSLRLILSLENFIQYVTAVDLEGSKSEPVH